MSAIYAVVWDIGRVLIDWQPEAFYDRELGADARARLFREVPLEAMNLGVDRGLPFKETVYRTASEFPEWADAIRWWHDRWIEMASPAIPGSAAILAELKEKGVPVFALTNFGADSFVLAQAHYPFLTGFDRYYVSAHLGTIKPEPAIYAALEDDCGVAPSRLLFVDDRPENIDAARARGWQGHQFIDAATWRRCLVDYGLLGT